MTDREFEENYKLLGKCKNDGFTDMDEAEKAAFILCDNIYRRISSAGSVGSAGIHLTFPSTGNLQNLTTLNLQKGAYSPQKRALRHFSDIDRSLFRCSFVRHRQERLCKSLRSL